MIPAAMHIVVATGLSFGFSCYVTLILIFFSSFKQVKINRENVRANKNKNKNFIIEELSRYSNSY